MDKDGNVVKPKARLVARGFSQVHTVDFMETYTPTPAASSVKCLVAVAVENNWQLRKVDVKQTFFQVDLDFNVFMKLLDGCGDKSGRVVKLNKSVYGLKQAGRRWAMRLGDVLVSKVEMEQCKADPCVFRLIRDDVVMMIVCFHVDDITVAGVFQTTEGELSWYLGCGFERDRKKGVLRVSQRFFVESVVSGYGIDAQSDLPAS